MSVFRLHVSLWAECLVPLEARRHQTLVKSTRKKQEPLLQIWFACRSTNVDNRNQKLSHANASLDWFGVSARSFHTNEKAEGESKLTSNGKQWNPKSDKFGNLAHASNCKAEKWAVSPKKAGGEQKRIKGGEPAFQKTTHRHSWPNKQ